MLVYTGVIIVHFERFFLFCKMAQLCRPFSAVSSVPVFGYSELLFSFLSVTKVPSAYYGFICIFYTSVCFSCFPDSPRFRAHMESPAVVCPAHPAFWDAFYDAGGQHQGPLVTKQS